MSSDKLENLLRIGQIHQESAREVELVGLKGSGLARLSDARKEDLAYSSRFDLAYNAAHALSLYALRRAGYRSDKRYTVFQTLPHTIGLSTGHWRVLVRAHDTRNTAEYEGFLREDEQLLADVIAATTELARILFDT